MPRLITHTSRCSESATRRTPLSSCQALLAGTTSCQGAHTTNISCLESSRSPEKARNKSKQPPCLKERSNRKGVRARERYKTLAERESGWARALEELSAENAHKSDRHCLTKPELLVVDIGGFVQILEDDDRHPREEQPLLA